MNHIQPSLSKISTRFRLALGGLLLLMITVAAGGLSGLESVLALAGAIEPLANQAAQAGAASARVGQLVSQLRVLLIVLTLLGLAFGGLMFWWVSRLTAPLPTGPADAVPEGQAAAFNGAVRSTEASHPLPAGLRHVNDQLVHLVGEQQVASNSPGAEPSPQASGDPQSTASPAAALEKTAALIDELGQASRQQAAIVQQTTRLASRTLAAAAQGRSVVSELTRTMDGLCDSSRHIGGLLGEVDGLAFRNNLLALGHAVEAARHSDVRSDFAVVAAEVIALALRSATLAREIRAAIDTTLSGIDTSQRLVAEAGSSLSCVIAHARGVDHLIGDIADTCIEQTGGMAQLVRAIRDVDQDAVPAAVYHGAALSPEHQAPHPAGTMGDVSGATGPSPVPAMAEAAARRQMASARG